MTNPNIPAKALIIGPNDLVPTKNYCAGCDRSIGGDFPGLRRVTDKDTDKGKPGDLIPACAKSTLGNLGHWNGHGGQEFSPELQPLRLFKCIDWAWVVVSGLRDDCPQHLLPAEPGLYHAYYRREATYDEDPNLTVANLLDTHVFVTETRADSLEGAYRNLQGHNWSPNGEARPLIAGLGLHHTSISIGDVLADSSGLHQVAEYGFVKLPSEKVPHAQD